MGLKADVTTKNIYYGYFTYFVDPHWKKFILVKGSFDAETVQKRTRYFSSIGTTNRSLRSYQILVDKISDPGKKYNNTKTENAEFYDWTAARLIMNCRSKSLKWYIYIFTYIVYERTSINRLKIKASIALYIYLNMYIYISLIKSYLGQCVSRNDIYNNVPCIIYKCLYKNPSICSQWNSEKSNSDT